MSATSADVRGIAQGLKGDEVRALFHAACTGGVLAKDSHIVQRCRRHLPKLVSAQLLTESPSSYVITDLGHRVSSMWSEVHGG